MDENASENSVCEIPATLSRPLYIEFVHYEEWMYQAATKTGEIIMLSVHSNPSGRVFGIVWKNQLMS